MHIRPFEMKKDISTLQSWFELHNMPDYLLEDLPSHGWIVFENHIPICAGFIREIEGGFAMIDSLISNSNINQQLRNNALERLSTKLIKIAKLAKVKSIIAITGDKNTYMRALSHGFREMPSKLIAFNLREML